MEPSPLTDNTTNTTSISPQSTPQSQDANTNNSQDGSNIVFNPGARFYFAFSSLTVLAMMVALDGTSVSVALPVSISSSTPKLLITKNTDHRK